MIIPFSYWGSKTKEYIDVANHAWGFCLRNPDYTGPLVKLRRWNGSSEDLQDFYPDSSGWVSLSEITTFYNGGVSTVQLHTAFDQFGSVNLSRAENDERFSPEVTDGSGNIYTINGKPSARFGFNVFGRTGLKTTTNIYTTSNQLLFASKESTVATFSPFVGFNNPFSFHGATQNGEAGASRNNLNDSFPYKLFVNEVLELNLPSSVPSQDQLHDLLVDGTLKIVTENYGTPILGSGFVWGATDPINQDIGYRGKSSEIIIYKGTMSDADIIKNQKILKASY